MSSTEPTPTDPAVRPDAADPAVRPDEADVADVAPELAPVEDDLIGFVAFVPATTAIVQDGPGLAARIGAEALGTFALVLVTIGTLVYRPLTGADMFGSALAAGLVLAVATATVGHVSGGHFNPAVTFGSAIAGRTAWLDVPLYLLAQVLGGVAAAAVLFSTIPAGLPGLFQLTDVGDLWGLTANGWDEGSPLWAMSSATVGFDLKAALLLETVAAALLVAVTLGSRHRRVPRGMGPITIGFAYAALLLVLSPVTGASLNPARSTAAAIFAGSDAIGQLWLFWAAPLFGAAIAGLAWFAFGSTDDDDEPVLAPQEDDELVLDQS